MRKRVLALTLVLALVLGISAQAAQTRSYQISPSLTFTGTTANCAVVVYGEDNNDAISITAKLYQGGTLLKTWKESGTGYVKLSESTTVTRGLAYILETTVTINGVKQYVPLVNKPCM